MVVWAGELTHRGQAIRDNLLLRVDHVCTWAKRLINFAPASGMVVDLCKRFIGILARAKAPIKDGAAINSIRYATGNRLQAFGLQLSLWSGGRTKHNRTNQSCEKFHWLAAVCGGATGGRVHIPPGLLPRSVSAAGRGSPRMCRVDNYGFPRTSAKARRVVNGCNTWDFMETLLSFAACRWLQLLT